MSHLSNKPGPRRFVIIGGGLAGWMTAAVLARELKREYGEIQLIETAGASGESRAVGTRPSFRKLSGLLGIDERDWMPATHATFKLGAEFRDWGRAGDGYFHGFGPCGARLEGVAFHQHWLRLQRLGNIPPFEDFAPVAALVRAGRFAPPAPDRRSPFHWYDYAYHLDRPQMTAYLRRYALRRGVQPVAGSVVALERHADSALISALRLDAGRADRFWIGNALVLGVCWPGPLEAPELQLLQSGVARFLGVFPGFTSGFERASAQEYNRLTIAEHDGVRDFLALHFIATTRDDSPFWRHCRGLEAPVTLRDRLELFRHSGRLGLAEDDALGEEGWLAVLLGQHVVPAGIDPLAAPTDPEHTRGALQMLTNRLHPGLAGRPPHRGFLARHAR